MLYTVYVYYILYTYILCHTLNTSVWSPGSAASPAE